MKVITNIARVAVVGVVVLVIGGCGCSSLVSRNEYLKNAIGPAKAPSTYRVGGVREETQPGSRVTLIRSADVASGWTGAASAPAHPAGAAPAGAAPAGGAAPAATPAQPPASSPGSSASKSSTKH